ncbi:hypothetical protein [Bosea sp. (in: a-proteobacteria)]|jgi:hypothetical protein|uniref:hypothetical protein n=1 Tax=Bosea sp. (in: a-proteobacteria) TaxID=1871050 RepID=UPI003F7300BD
MTHPVDEMLAEAQAAIRRMKEAAIAARHLHARAELMRHMRTTAGRVAARPLDEAAALVAREWMNAWSLDAGAYPELARDVAAFTAAFCADARGSTPETQAAIRLALDGLEAGFLRVGTSLSDQMAFRSECAHGWWQSIVPLPVDLQDADRRDVPRLGEGEPFWSAGAQPHCG